ncbi:hypothetical protein [Escherichia coli]|uniref:hypothetical protein n=1 Tax=Escherichia coli TaxID=562 RepID=UPI000BEAD4CA|nr:hypothetical protein [Escherichia coli]
MLPSETMIWQPEFTDKTLSRKPGAVHFFFCTPKGQLQRFTLLGGCHTLCSLSALAGYNGSWPKTAIT